MRFRLWSSLPRRRQLLWSIRSTLFALRGRKPRLLRSVMTSEARRIGYVCRLAMRETLLLTGQDLSNIIRQKIVACRACWVFRAPGQLHLVLATRLTSRKRSLLLFA